MKYPYRVAALRITLLYITLAGLWILLTDRLLQVFISNPDVLTIIQTWKGLGFVLFSAVLLYVILQPALREREALNLELERHARQQEAVATLRNLALNSTRLSLLIDEAVMLITIALEVEYSSVLEFSPDEPSLLLRAGTGWPDSLIGTAVLDAGTGTFASYALTRSEPVVIEDLPNETRFSPPSFLVEHGIVGSMTVIITGDDHPFGLLGIHTNQQRVFTTEERRFLGAISNVLATAIARQRAEAELRKQKTLLESQTETSLDGILVVDPAEKILSYNQRFVEMWGIPRSLMHSRSNAAVLKSMGHHLADPQQFIERVQQLRQQRDEKTRTEIVLKDGRIFDRYSAPVEDADGTYYGRVYYYRDVTDFRRAQEARRESEERFRLLVESMDDIVFTLDRQQRHTGVFGRWIERYGLSADQFLGKTPRDTSQSEAEAALHEAANRRALGGEYVMYEWSTSEPLRYFQTSLSPIRNASGEVTGLVGVGRDITALKQAEEAYRTLVDNSLQGLIIVQEQQIVFANTEMTRISGYSVEELLNLSFHDLNALIHPADRDRIWQYLHDRLAGKPAPQRYEMRVFRKDGKLRWLEASGAPTRFRGQLAAQGAYIDITERKRVEEELKRHNRELAALNLVTETVNLFLTLPDVLTTLKVLLSDHLHIAAGAIFIYHEEKDHLSLELAWGLPQSMKERFSWLPVANAYNERVIREQTTCLLHDMNSEAPALYRVLNADDLSESHWKSYLGVPILAQGTVQGVMDLFGASLATFSPDQVTFFATLGQQVGTAIQNARLYEEVQVARERLQTLSGRLVKVQEAERRTIARELHDEVGQILTGLNLTLELVARLPPEQVQERIEHAQNLVNELMLRVRKMSLELRPPMLDDLGLLPALLWHFEHYTEQTGVHVMFKHTGIEQRFPAELETAVYRMIQEALTNVARYAGVGEVVVRLWANQEALSVQVEDQGSGFDPEAVLQNHTSSGLSGMHERIRLLNGRLTIESAPGQGSYLAMELPLT